jgi:hypothetical protein
VDCGTRIIRRVGWNISAAVYRSLTLRRSYALWLSGDDANGDNMGYANLTDWFTIGGWDVE